MSVRVATFNAENLMQRFDFSGYKDALRRDRTLAMLNIRDEAQYRDLEQARIVAHTDDKLQLAALAIADTDADIVCLQEVENIEALNAFEYGYLYKMIGKGYRNKYLENGNDGRGIDVAVMMREETADGQKIELVEIKSHADLTYGDFDLIDEELEALGEKPDEKVFRRDCLVVDLLIGGHALTLFIVHLKSMGTDRDDIDGRVYTNPVRRAESRAVRKIIEDKFNGKTANKRWLICGDLNDYSSRLVIDKAANGTIRFEFIEEEQFGFKPLMEDGFCESLVARRPEDDRWTLYYTEGPQVQHLVQLDYLLASPALAESNPLAVPDIIRNGQPYRTIFPPGQEVERYPRTGWDRPKASDHCPVAVTLNIL